MKRFYSLFFLAVAMLSVACAPNERTFVVLSTNDMHARIQHFPQLASAVAACRDTTEVVLLVDAGDRWTGNAYVDKVALPGLPVIELMNRLGYDVATLGNHEFDHGQAHLARLIDSMECEVIAANTLSDTCSFPTLPSYAIIKRHGVRFGFVGVVTNYEGEQRPAGNASSYLGLHFPDPQQSALAVGEALRKKVDVLVLLSHMGDDRDMEFLAAGSPYDLVIGGHTHQQVDTLVGEALLTQTGKNLNALGVTKIVMRKREIVSVDFDLLPLADRVPDPAFQAEVERYYADPTLNAPVGEFSSAATKEGLAYWMAEAIADEADADIGIYHIGGVRLDSIEQGGVSTAKVYDLEPFGSGVARVEMTPAQLRELIIAKYNDTENRKEAHRLDLYATTPYVIVTDGADQALDVVFPDLRDGKHYEVAMCDYIFRNYKQLHYFEGGLADKKVADILLEELREESPLTPSNTPRQRVVVRH